MAKIPFDIKYRPQIESGEYKVETRDGRPARVICWDFNDGDYVIVAVVPNICGTRGFITYTDEGIYMIGEENVFDLFLITTEPELKENEDDERTRKEIIEHFLPHKNELLVKKWIAYLEKQKEQKPVEWSEEDEQYLLVCKNALNKYQRSDRWDATIIITWLENRLKSLRPQPHWKPSEEQIISVEELEYFIETELHKDEFIRKWPQYEFHVPDHREGDEYSSGVAVGVGRAINALKNFITNKIAEHDSK